MKVSGEITDENDMLLTNYNGEVSTTIFDKTRTTTLNNDGNSPAINFDTLAKRFLEVMPLLQTAYLNLVCSSQRYSNSFS
jgi:hypothetical protein